MNMNVKHLLSHAKRSRMRHVILRLSIPRAIACLGGGSIVALGLPRVIAKAEPQRCVVVDAVQSVDDVQREVCAAVSHRLGADLKEAGR